MDVKLLIGNDQTIELVALRDEISGEYFTAATVTATIKDLRGTVVAGGSLPVTLQYVLPEDDAEGRKGLFRGNLENSLELKDGRTYWVEVTAVAGIDLNGFWRFPIPAEYRGAE